MANNPPEPAKGLHESFISSPISNNENEAVERQGERAGRCRTEDENVSSFCCVPRRISLWKPSVEESSHTIDFFLDTSLHGLKYVGQPQRHFLERLFWFTSFIIGCGVAAWLIADIWINFFTNPIVVTFQNFETTIEQIPFPAVTICNMNKVLKSKAEGIIDRQKLGKKITGRRTDTDLYVHYLEHICSSSRSFNKNFNGNNSFDDRKGRMHISSNSHHKRQRNHFAWFRSNNTQKCEDMILRCVWRGAKKNCGELFKRNEASEFGTWDEKDWAKETALWPNKDLGIDGFLNKDSTQTTYPSRQFISGRSSGLSILIDPSLSEYFCTDSDSEGFLIQTHLPIDAPNVHDFGIAIKPNSETFINIKPEITMANREIKSYGMDKRNCYFAGEFKLAYYNYYTISNCLDECVSNHTYSRCNCVPFYTPQDDSRRFCDPLEIPCHEENRKEFLKLGKKKVCSKCYPTCTDLEYLHELSSAPLQTSGKPMADNGTEADIGARSNISIVHIYFGQDSTIPRYRTKLFGWKDLIANTGGLLGLCLGFSGLSLIECLYFFTLRAWCRTRERRSIWAIMSSNFHKIWGPDNP